MADFIAVVVILLLLGLAIWYLYKEKKRGVRCVGCSMGGCCTKGCGCDKPKAKKSS